MLRAAHAASFVARCACCIVLFSFTAERELYFVLSAASAFVV